MDLKIRGNSAVITASSSGLGKAAAAALVKEGVNVVINGSSIIVDGGSGRSNL